MAKTTVAQEVEKLNKLIANLIKESQATSEWKRWSKKMKTQFLEEELGESALELGFEEQILLLAISEHLERER